MVFLQPCNVMCTPLILVRSLVNRHPKQRGWTPRFRSKGGGHCRVNSSTDPHNPTVQTGPLHVITHPPDDVINNAGGINRARGMQAHVRTTTHN